MKIQEKERAKTDDKPAETDEKSTRKRRISMRADYMLEFRRPFENRIKRSLLLYSGQSLDKDAPDRVKYVSPFAFIFTEAKTAEEARAMSEFEIVPVEDEGDAWKVPFLKDAIEHVKDKTLWRSKRIQLLRMKNIAGVGIVRVGNRTVMGKRKIGEVYDEFGRMTGWNEQEVPVYDDLFIDLVPPLDFIVDPNSMTMNDAMDCGHFHAEHIEQFRENYSDGRFYDVMSIKEGDNDMVGVYEHFDKVGDEWITYAFPSRGAAHETISQEVGAWTEIGALPLPDDHKKLPFASFHDNSCFADIPVEQGVSRTDTGEATSRPVQVRDSETFWTQGVPSVIEDLIDLDSDFGRSSFRALDLAGQTIIATAQGYSLDEAVQWQSGKQAVGALNKIQTFNLGGSINLPAFDSFFTRNFERMVMSIGADPRNLTDIGKVQTATQSMIQNETAARRLNLGITFNEENGETLLGQLLVEDTQQYYTKQEIVRLTGKEPAKELEAFDEIEYGGKDKKIPVVGKRPRRIKSSRKVIESAKGKISAADHGVSSFLARPETIRTRELDIKVIPRRRAGQSDAVSLENNMKLLELSMKLYPMTVTQFPGQQPPISIEELPKIGDLVETIQDLLGGKRKPKEDKESKKTNQILSAREEQKAKRQPII